MLKVEFKEIDFELVDGKIGWLALKREYALNALNWGMVEEIHTAIEQLRVVPMVRCLVLTGHGRAFCAGADLKALGGLQSNELLSKFIKTAGTLFDRIEALPFPTIAALNGTTMAGGLELALSCDLIVASDSAKIADAHANFGQIPGGGATVRLPERIGMSRAKFLMYSGSSISAAKASEWGLVDQVFEDSGFVASTLAFATRIASKSPLGLRSIKSLLDRAPARRSALDAELSECARYFQSLDQREGMLAFTEKREPRFMGA